MSKRLSELANDQRGAVMLTGIFMSCFLIGALWFVIGIGDALVFRHMMQEAADAGAYSAATMNAKGMNYIAMLNLVMIAGVAVYLVMGVVSDVLGVIHTACVWGSTLGGNPACLAGCAADYASDGVLGNCPTYYPWNGAYNAWDRYFGFMKRGFLTLHDLQHIATYVYPLAGTAQAYEVGKSYETDNRRHGPVNVVAVSAAMFPEGAVRLAQQKLAQMTGDRSVLVAADGRGTARKEGMLPVEPKHFSGLCKQAPIVAAKTAIDLLGLGKVLSGGHLAGKVLRFFTKIIGSGLQWRYCSEDGTPWFMGIGRDAGDFSKISGMIPYVGGGGGPGWNEAAFWKSDGYYTVYSGTKNGDVFMETWAMSISDLRDDSESKVAMSGQHPTGARKYQKLESDQVYFAEAEIYFDCEEKWGDDSCNGDDNAMFSIRWRSRMKSLDYPEVFSGLAEASIQALLASGANSRLPRAVSDRITPQISRVLSNVPPSVIAFGVQKLVTLGEKFAVGQATPIIMDAAERIDPHLEGVYH